MKNNYWLLKSEPTCYSIDDLKKDKKTAWSGVRNYQARNFIKSMKKGDRVLFYHSSVDPVGVVGIAEIVKEAYPDTTALNPQDDHFDPKATKENPMWFMVDVVFKSKFKREVTLPFIKINPKLKGIGVAERGSRLSVMPVSEDHFNVIADYGLRAE